MMRDSSSSSSSFLLASLLLVFASRLPSCYSSSSTLSVRRQQQEQQQRNLQTTTTTTCNTPFDPIRINCGSHQDVTDENGIVWSADMYYEQVWGGAGSVTCSGSGSNTTTNNNVLCTRRHGHFMYNIPIPEGCGYVVRLQLDETSYSHHHGNLMFNILVEDQLTTGIDIIEKYGIAQAASTLVYSVDSSDDGMLTIEIDPVAGPGGMLSSIEVLPVLQDTSELSQSSSTSDTSTTGTTAGTVTFNRGGSGSMMALTDAKATPTLAPTTSHYALCRSQEPIRINCGPSMDIVDENGMTWIADTPYVTTILWGNPQTHCRVNNQDPALLCNRRQGAFRYTVPVQEGCDYVVKLQFYETIAYMEIGGRVFDFKVEDQQVTNFDILQLGNGQPYVPIEESFLIRNSDGMMNIDITRAFSWGALLSSIEILPYIDTPQPTAAPTISAAPTPVPTQRRYWEEIDPAAPLIKRHEGCSTFANGKVYLIGGRREKPVSIYDPKTDTWTQGPWAGLQLHHMQCITIGDSIWIPTSWTMGYPNEVSTDKIYIYNTITNTWSTKPGLPPSRRRGGAAAVLYDNKIWVSHGNIGGHETGDHAKSVGYLDYFDLVLDKWVTGPEAGLPDAPNPRDHTGGGLVNGRMICIASGRNGGELGWPLVPQTDCYDPMTNQWTVEEDIPVPSGGALYGTSCNGMLLVAGGETDVVAYKNLSAFDGTTWHELPPMRVSRHGISLAVDCENNKIYAASGSIKPGGSSGETHSIEVFHHNGIFL